MMKVIIFGGNNGEHFVSLASAKHICGSCGFDRYLYVALGGSVFEVSKEVVLGYIPDFKSPLNVEHNLDCYPSIEALLNQAFDGTVFFIAMHGKGVEDGILQELLERRANKFTGSDSKASLICFNKLNTLLHLAQYGIQGAPRIMSSEWDPIFARQFFGESKLIAKPVASGSSISLQYLDSVEAYQVEHFASDEYLIEKRIIGREFTCGVIQDSEGDVRALSPVEIVAETGEFSYGAKYLSDRTAEICPAVIESDVFGLIQSNAVVAHKALGCFGYSRSDFMFDGKDLYFLEINTLPGLTTRSLLTLELKEAGIEFSSFIEGQIQLAFHRPVDISNKYQTASN